MNATKLVTRWTPGEEHDEEARRLLISGVATNDMAQKCLFLTNYLGFFRGLHRIGAEFPLGVSFVFYSMQLGEKKD